MSSYISPAEKERFIALKCWPEDYVKQLEEYGLSGEEEVLAKSEQFIEFASDAPEEPSFWDDGSATVLQIQYIFTDKGLIAEKRKEDEWKVLIGLPREADKLLHRRACWTIVDDRGHTIRDLPWNEVIQEYIYPQLSWSTIKIWQADDQICAVREYQLTKED